MSISQPSSSFAYYFAYGSNMSKRYLSQLRGVQIQASHAASLSGYRLVFNLPGIIPLEPSFANLIPDASATAHGVIHKISIADFRKIFASELEHYSLTTVQVESPALGSEAKSISAKTLIARGEATETIPSRRYLQLLIAGAQEHQLPQDYIQQLHDKGGLYIPVLSEGAGLLTKAHVYWNARRRKLAQ